MAAKTIRRLWRTGTSTDAAGGATGEGRGTARDALAGPVTADVPHLLVARDLEATFTRGHGGGQRLLRAVDNVSLTLDAGETLGIVGESGSGKSTLARVLMRLIEPSAGSVVYDGTDLLTLTSRQMRDARRHIQMVFQDPYASLHPMRTVAEIISEPWKVHRGILDRSQRGRRVVELLEQVGLSGRYANLYPGQMSGGQRQRVAIARALASQPKVLILDEPVSALDVSIQAQVITLLKRLQQDLGLAYLFISHDLALVRLVSDRVAVMSAGHFVETGTADEVYSNPQHPYTKELLASAPSRVLEEAGAEPADPLATADALADAQAERNQPAGPPGTPSGQGV
jgi:ABC-type glutathione transport system ATPase component